MHGVVGAHDKYRNCNNENSLIGGMLRKATVLSEPNIFSSCGIRDSESGDLEESSFLKCDARSNRHFEGY